MPFLLDGNPTDSEISEAVNYILGNLSQSVTADSATGQITGPTGQITGYLYKYLSVKYADSFDGTLNFSNSPTGRAYYGIRNSNSSTESTNPIDYTWTRVTGGFGTTKFFYYLTTGGRQIQIAISTSVPNPGWVVDSGSAIDLDVTNATNSVANFVVIRVANNSAAPTDSECISAIGRTPISGDLCTVNYNSGIFSIVYKYTTGWAIFQKYITGDLIVANSIVGNNIAANTITGNNIAANTVTASNINSNNLTIKDGSGNILFGSGTNLNYANIIASSGWLNSNVSISSSGTLSGAGGGTVTVSGLDNSILRSANPITAANISTYISGAAIGTAYIANAAITNAKIGNAEVSTLSIAGNAVTIPVSGSGSSFSATATIVLDASTPIQVTALFNNAYIAQNSTSFYIYRNGIQIQSALAYALSGDYSAPIVLIALDTPGAGTHTYSLGYPVGPYLTVSNSVITLLAVKR